MILLKLGHHTIQFTLFLVLSYPFTGFPNTNEARAQSTINVPAKVSPDLSEIVRKDQGGARVKAIIQFHNEVAGPLDWLLRNLGVETTRRLRNMNARAVVLPAQAIGALAKQREVKYISLDKEIGTFGHLSTTTGTDAIRLHTSTLLGSLITTVTTVDGTGIGVAVVDSGVDSDHLMFRNSLGSSRVIVDRDFTGENRTDDPYGHGTHVASIAAGNDVIANGAYTGIAPNANLINLRVLNSQGVGTTSSLLAALDWILTNHAIYNLRVVNLSLGTSAVDAYWNDPVCLAVRRLVDAGVIVVAAAGNNGKDSSGTKIYGQIHSPGNEPSAITVGASNTFGSETRSDDGVTSFSSRGPTRSYWTDANGVKHYDNLIKPDIVAPGNRIIAAAASGNLLLATNPELDANVNTMDNRQMMYLSGSSMATPIAAGAVALLLQANPSLTPNLIKVILMNTSQQLAGANMFEQGAGEINIEGAMRLARLVRSNLTEFTAVGEPLLTSAEPETPQTTISGYTFTWAQGVILNHTYATGSNLITKYQKVYRKGYILNDGVVESEFSQVINLQRMSSGLELGAGIPTSDGSLLGSGTIFLSTNLLLGNGIMIGDGIMVGDGIMIGDGIMVGDGIMIGDTFLQAQSAMICGDNTSAMR